MSKNITETPDPEDFFNDTRMSFGDHLEDLRTHLLRALKGFLIGMVLGFWPLGPWVLGIIVDPVSEQLYQFELRKLAKEKQKYNARIEAGDLKLRGLEFKMLFKKDQIQKM